MGAHDSTGRDSAHHSPIPSVKPKFMNVDETGVSMSWKTAGGVLFLVCSGIAAVLAFIATLATKDDVRAHDGDQDAHVITITNPYSGQTEDKPMPEVVSKMQKDIMKVKNKVDEIDDQVGAVQDTVVIDQAERLADRAADRQRHPERKIRTWKYVKERAIQNRKEGKPLRDGLEEMVF